MWGIIPAAGAGSRIQPLAFSKELLPVGSRREGAFERPRAVSEYLLERMILGGVTKICFVIAPGKSDILEYYGGSFAGARLFYAVQPQPAGLCDAIFQALPLIHPDDSVVFGLPDTIWFPRDALQTLGCDCLSFLLFPVERPEFFDAVITDGQNRVERIEVKRADAHTNWIWGAFRMPGSVFEALHRMWCERSCTDEYLGDLVNAFISSGGHAEGVRAGKSYVDVGTIDGYRGATQLLAAEEKTEQP